MIEITTDALPLHSYLLVREDIPLAAQMAQCAHAAQEAAFMLGSAPTEPIHVVILGCLGESELLAAASRLSAKGFEPGLFHEPHWPQGHTALFLKPQRRCARLRSAMSSYPLWGASTPSLDALDLDAGAAEPSLLLCA